MATKKCRKNDFCEKSPVHSANTLGIKNVIKISLSRTVSEIKVFLCFMQKFKMAAKNGGQAILGKNRQTTLGFKIFVEITLSHTVSEIFKIFHFHL